MAMAEVVSYVIFPKSCPTANPRGALPPYATTSLSPDYSHPLHPFTPCSFLVRTDARRPPPELWALYASKVGALGCYPHDRNRFPDYSGAVIPHNFTYLYIWGAARISSTKGQLQWQRTQSIKPI